MNSWDGDGQGALACCDSWGHKESDTTERLNWTELNLKPLYIPEEKTWLLQEGAQPQGDWLQKQGCYVLPQSQATQTLTDIHQALHIGTKPLYHLLRPLITYPNLLSLLWQVTHSCIICSSVSLQGALKPILSFPTHQAPGHIPGEDWQIDFTHMPPTLKIKLVFSLVDTFSGWIEALPMRSETASEVTQFLIWETIPCFGLQSENGQLLSPKSLNK